MFIRNFRVSTQFFNQSMSCDLIYGCMHRTIQEQVAHPKINDENSSLCVGYGGSYFCAKSLSDLEQATYTMMPLLQKLQTTSEKVTLKVGIDLDGTIVHIDGTIDPSTIFNAMARNGITLDFKSNERFDHVSIIFHKQFLSKLLKIKICLFTLFPL